ncbi:hypothetical protein Poli38472_011448 [Pythium oligandrum]|uniref:Purple acid phosphatase n=1 Tax=Pythium oligandrum TaxID=41045 RepID=A0A8K1CLK1_PYTOL|nr:hypothetical protein Poli38472_011448 [Pythium oligandrum]|eukprot:TMW64568.1 hypothetical protein Poli38472_011448 [Pythium oligandrum]
MTSSWTASAFAKRGLVVCLTALTCASFISASNEASVNPGSEELRELSAFDGDIMSPAFSLWRYRWHRGGAWMPHESLHPCQTMANCSISHAQPLRPIFELNTTLVPQLGYVDVHFDLGKDDKSVDGDFIGVYCVDQEEVAQRFVDAREFIDYALVGAGESRGRVVFGPLVNMRCSYQFQYMRHLATPKYQLLGESPHVEMEKGYSEPVQIHLALTEKPGEMRVMWTSGRGAHQHVHYGPVSKNLTSHAEASSATYAATDMCSVPASYVHARWFRHPGYLHEAVMTGLEPGMTYYYAVGSKLGIVSREFSFIYTPAVGVDPADDNLPSTTQSFFVFGDLGQAVLEKVPADDTPERLFRTTDYQSRLGKLSDMTVMKRIEQDLDEDVDGNYVALVHIGDLSYATGRTYVWDQFGAIIEPVASRLPYMVGIGNHEYDYLVGGHGHDLSGSDIADTNGWHPKLGNFGNDSHGECGVPSVKRFQMPANGNKLFWYSFKVGLTHHIVLSSEHDSGPHAPMHTWLKHELKHNVNRTKTPWLLVHIHRPLYCSENYKSDYQVSHLLRKRLDSIFMKHHVDVVFSGHYHAYERTCPVYKEQCLEDETTREPRAPIHLMIGSGGAELDDIDYLDAAWSRHRLQEYGYGRFHVHNASHAKVEYVRSRDRHVADQVWIVSSHDWPVDGTESETEGQ